LWIQTNKDIDRQIAAWQAEHPGPAVVLANLLCDLHTS
jgi:hypothetical protein